MVHSGLIFWLEKLCKRRRFLSDLRNQLFLRKAGQDPFQPVLTDSGGPSLPLLTRWWPAHSWPPVPPESGNMRTGLPASGGPSKRSMYAVCTAHNTEDGTAQRCHGATRPGSGPPIKVAGVQITDFELFHEPEFLYRF